MPYKDIEIQVPRRNGHLNLVVRQDEVNDKSALYIHCLRPCQDDLDHMSSNDPSDSNSSRIQVGDELLQIDDHNVEGMNLESIVKLMSSQSSSENALAIIKVRRYNYSTTYENFNREDN